MKKVLICVLLIAMLLSITACSQDLYSKLGTLMGSIGNNIYGIKPDLTKVNNTSQSIDNTVVPNSDPEHPFTIKLDNAEEIINSIVEINESEKQKEALKEELKKPVNGDKGSDIKTAMQDALTKSADSPLQMIKSISTAGLKDELKDLLKTVEDSINAVSNGISDNPTKAELATVVAINQVAGSVKEAVDKKDILLDDNRNPTAEGLKVFDNVLGAVTTLKITSAVAGIDVLGGLSSSDLLGILKGISLSRDAKADFASYLKAMSNSLRTITAILAGEDGKFDLTKYKNFIGQAQLVKSCYDTIALAYVNDVSDVGGVDKILDRNITYKFTEDDISLYFMVSMFVEADKVASARATAFFRAYINNHYGALTSTGEGDLVLSAEENTKLFEMLSTVVGKTIEIGDWTAFGSTLANCIFTVGNGFGKDAITILGTTAVMIADVGLQKALGLISGEAATFSAIFNKLISK